MVLEGVITGIENLAETIAKVFDKTMDVAKEIIEEAKSLIGEICPVTKAVEIM